MKFILILVVLGSATADLPPTRYSAPNGGFNNGFGAPNRGFTNGFGAPSRGFINGFGASNGAPNGGYTPPSNNGYGVPQNNGFRAGSNGFGANGFGGRPSNGYAPPNNGYGYGQDEELVALQENIPGGGVPGEDYPVLASVPDTGFSCDDQAVQGYYADTTPEAGCQVFHICQDRALRRQQDSFLCPNGTIFNQQYLVCDWWFNFDCATAQNFYFVNELIGVVPDAGYGYTPPTNGNGNGRNGANGYLPSQNGVRGPSFSNTYRLPF